MKQTIQQINLTQRLPVHIKLWNGSFELHTHPELSIKIDATGIANLNNIPLLTMNDKCVQLSNQSFSTLLMQSSAIKIKIYVPDESIVYLRQINGSLLVSGSYNKLETKNYLGNVYCHLDNIFVHEQANLQVISGDVYIDAEDQTIIKSRRGYENFQLFKFYNGSSMKVRSYIGDVICKLYSVRKKYNFA